MKGELRPSYTDQQLTEPLVISHACPVLYRFMADRHIDEFLEKGQIQISTIPHCRKTEDARRSDRMESVYRYDFEWNDCITSVNALVGENAFVLCCSLTQCAIHDKAHTNCLELHDWHNLAAEIGEQLRIMGYTIGEIFDGPCNYAQKIRSINMRPNNNGDVTIEEILSRIGQEALYTTKHFSFVEEHEYRIMWLSREKIPEDPIIVTVKEPKRYGCKVPAIGRTYA
jgi:hypothetical protein